MKAKILFVDDEQNILDSLRLSLRNMRGEWDMSFSLGGEEALKALAETPHDVVVSDMRMPGMDGADLLKEIQTRNPQMARIILSGYSDKDGVLKNICLAHQYLGKPCRTPELIQAIRRALNLHRILANEDLKRIIASIETLPVLPQVYMELVDALVDENVSLRRIGNILAQDMGLVASILRVVNCPFFGFSSRVSNIHQAVTLLGTQTLRTLVLSTHLFSTLDTHGLKNFSVIKLWDHSIRVAGFAKSIAEKEGLPDAVKDNCVIAGMLHDIGKLVLSTKLPREFAEVLSRVNSDNCPVHVAEQALLHTTHAEIGAYLLGLWGFNHDQMDAVRWHQAIPPDLGKEPNTPLVVHAANILDHQIVRLNPEYAERTFDVSGDILSVLDRKIAAWRDLCQKSLDGGDPVGQ